MLYFHKKNNLRIVSVRIKLFNHWFNNKLPVCRMSDEEDNGGEERSHIILCMLDGCWIDSVRLMLFSIWLLCA